MNSAARLLRLYSERSSDHVSPLPRELHWLRVSERIDFRLALLVYRCMNGTLHHATSPVSYNGSPTVSRVDARDLHRQRCCTFHGRCTRPSTTVSSPLPLWESGTCYHRRSPHCRYCRLSSVHWRWNCFADRTTTHITGNSSIDTIPYVTFTAALKFCLRLVSPWNSWMIMIVM